MPLYEYCCKSCRNREDHFSTVEKRDRKIRCSCGGQMIRVLNCNYGISMNGVPAGGYYDENLGTYINSVTHKRQVMQEQGVTEKIGKGWY